MYTFEDKCDIAWCPGAQVDVESRDTKRTEMLANRLTDREIVTPTHAEAPPSWHRNIEIADPQSRPRVHHLSRHTTTTTAKMTKRTKKVGVSYCSAILYRVYNCTDIAMYRSPESTARATALR